MHSLRAWAAFLARNQPFTRWELCYVSLSMHSGRGVAHPVPTMTLSQPSLAPTMCMSPCRWPHPPPSVSPFLVIQNPHASVQRLSFLLSAQCDTHTIKLLGPLAEERKTIWNLAEASRQSGRQVGIRLRPACFPLLCQGSKWFNCKSIWLVLRRSWVRIPAGSWIFSRGFISHSHSKKKTSLKLILTFY